MGIRLLQSCPRLGQIAAVLSLANRDGSYRRASGLCYASFAA
jgi:hypothetical protein